MTHGFEKQSPNTHPNNKAGNANCESRENGAGRGLRLGRDNAIELAQELQKLMLAQEKAIQNLPAKYQKGAELEAKKQFKTVSSHILKLDHGQGTSAPRKKSMPFCAATWLCALIRLSPFSQTIKSPTPILLDEKAAINLTIDSWKLMFEHEKTVNRLPLDQQRAALVVAEEHFLSIFRHIQDIVYDIFRIEPYEGTPYDPHYPHYPLDAVNKEMVSEEKKFVVVTTLEPAIIRKSDNLDIRAAKVVIGEDSSAQQTTQI